MVIKNMGTALRYCIPMSVGKKLGEYWELMKVGEKMSMIWVNFECFSL